MICLPELLAPAGGMEQLKAAYRFGADAAYVGLPRFGLRAAAGNFTPDTLRDAACLARGFSRKLYVAMNSFPWDEEMEDLLAAARLCLHAGVDALIVSDPGVVAMLRAELPDMPLHLSTQAHTVNARAAAFWHAQGVERVILARELSLERIRAMRDALPETLVLEAFVHGAVCYAYSGRCLLSQAMTGRHANRGECAQPCRWSYEITSKGHDPVVFEGDQNGAHLLSARDLCMIAHIPALCDAGVSSLKIEGRMKNAYYVATVVSTYRRALDAYAKDPHGYTDNHALHAALIHELQKASHRMWDTGFYFGTPKGAGAPGYTQTMEVKGTVNAHDAGKREALIQLKNKVILGDTIEALTPGGTFTWQLDSLRRAEDGALLCECGVPNTMLYVNAPYALEAGDMLCGICRNHVRKEEL